jgi:hypothetical protein
MQGVRKKPKTQNVEQQLIDHCRQICIILIIGELHKMEECQISAISYGR